MAQKAERIGVPPPHHGGGPGRGQACGERDLAVEVLDGCRPEHFPSPHQADDDASACERWRLAAFLLLGPCCGERSGVAHVALVHRGVQKIHPFGAPASPKPREQRSAPPATDESFVCSCALGGLDPAVGALDVRDAELVDMTVEGIGDAAHMPSDTEES